MKLTRAVVCLDLETTGLWVEKDKIIEIGMLRYSPGEKAVSYCRRVHPGIPIPPQVTALTGIRDSDVRDASPFAAIVEEVLAFIGDADFAGFNVERFDLPILERECFEAGARLEWRHRTVYDAQKIYHIHEKRDLKAAYRFFCGKDLTNAHSALDDAQAALEILEEQVRKYGSGSEYLEALIDFEYEPTQAYFDADRKFRWWNGELYPVFGKYGRRYCLREIAEKEPAYLRYLMTTDFDEKVKNMLQEVLAGRYPRPEPAVTSKRGV